MATHSSILAWRISWTEELGGLQSTGSQRVGHDFTYLCCTSTSKAGETANFHFTLFCFKVVKISIFVNLGAFSFF